MRLRENISMKRGGPCGRPFLLLGLVAACLTGMPQAVHAQGTDKYVERSDDDLVLLSVRVGRRLVAESISGYATQKSLMLPLGQLASVLQFPITVSPADANAQGWFLDTSQTFALDIAHGEAIIAGDRRRFEPGQVEVHRDDVYVDSKLLSQWFPLNVDFSFSEQSLTITAQGDVLLPVQEIEERERSRLMLEGQREEGENTPLPRLYAPYEFATIPYTDLTYSSGYDKQVRNGTYNEMSALATGDLLYMQNRVYASADQEENLIDLRWTLSRRDPDGQLLQPGEKLRDTQFGEALHALEVREVALGDINTPQLPLTALSQPGRGVLVSNIPYDRATRYDRTTLQGDILPGWEVELYRNDELLSFQRASSNGRYEFPDIPLISGLNIIRLVFYGPFGQKREEVQRFRVTPEVAEAGKSFFRFSASQQDTSIFDIQKRNRVAYSLVGSTPLQQEVVRGEHRDTFEYEYGLTDNIGLFANAAHFTTPDDEERSFGSLGLATTVWGTYARADYSRDLSNDGNAYSLLLQDTLWGVSLSGETQHYRNFIGDYSESITDPLEDNTLVRADTPLNLLGWRLNAGVDTARKSYESGRLVRELGGRLATSIRSLALTHNLTYRRDSSPGGTALVLSPITSLPVTQRFFDKQLRGELIASFPFYRNAFLRSSLRYNLKPQREIESASVSAEYRFTQDTNALFQIDRQVFEPALTTYTLGINHRFEHFLVGGRASHRNDGDNALGAIVSLSFGPNPRTGALEVFPEYTARDGIIAAKAYQDTNANGTYDYADPPVQHAQFLINRGGNNEERTNEYGNVLMRNLQADVHNRVMLDETSLETPYLVAGIPGFDVVPRAGVPTVIDYPVRAAGDVEGTVYLSDADGNRKGAANVALQLVDSQGNVVKETRTAYDGYYLMDTVPAGQYALRVAPEQAQRLRLAAEQRPTITIGQELDNILTADLSIHSVTDVAPQTLLADQRDEPPAEPVPVTPVQATAIAPPAAMAVSTTPVPLVASAPVSVLSAVAPPVAVADNPAAVQVAAQSPLPPRTLSTVPAEWNW